MYIVCSFNIRFIPHIISNKLLYSAQQNRDYNPLLRVVLGLVIKYLNILSNLPEIMVK